LPAIHRSIAIAFAFFGSIEGAAAQYYYPASPPGFPPPPPPVYSYRPYPPAPIYQDDNGGGAYHARYDQPRASYPADDSDGYDAPLTPPYFAPQPLPAVGDEPAMRPPGDVGGAPSSADVTGTIPNPTNADAASAVPRPAQNSAAAVAALPPEDQPEQGPAKQLPPQFRRQLVDFATPEPPGTIIIDTPNTYLYLVLGRGTAMRYGIGVGREGFTWSGTERVSRMSEWPDWFPPKEMIERQPYLPRFMAGGETNPLGARALYLGNTLYRIHGTNQPSTIGTFVSSGCIRLTNDDIEDLYSRVSLGTRVVVLPGSSPATASNPPPVAR
jgi:lipoprotein-anchoring transpeptidase ErfK/SrfK